MRKIRLGLLGCGVVGSGVLRILRDNAEMIEDRLGGALEVSRIVARRKDAIRGEDIPRDRLGWDPADVIGDESIDVIVEVMGGLEPAGSIVRAALKQGKHVVTANKALLAEHGNELRELANVKGVDLYFEAAVGGGIPIIRVLREALVSDRVVSLRGIVNGTSNYILSRMQIGRIDFEEALREAKDAGYAEADPTLDLSGVDAAHKLTILAMLAFGARMTPSQVVTQGIERITATDMKYADRFGYVIKPLAVANALADGSLDLRVHPALVPKANVLASISGALNAVYLEGAMLGPCMLSGLGAGALPTAVSVVSDIVDVGRNLLVGAHGRVPSRSFRGGSAPDPRILEQGDRTSRFYLRFLAADRPGVLARIAGVLGAFNVSIEQMIQEGRGDSSEGRSQDSGLSSGSGASSKEETGAMTAAEQTRRTSYAPEGPVSVVMLTHLAREAEVLGALREIDALGHVAGPTRAIPIEAA